MPFKPIEFDELKGSYTRGAGKSEVKAVLSEEEWAWVCEILEDVAEDILREKGKR